MIIKLDKYQKDAVYTDNRNSLIVAAPGSGKTTVIINRVFYLINNRHINPDNIIVITFTKAAAMSMKKRYLNLLGEFGVKSVTAPFFGTLHGLFYKILKNYYGSIEIIKSDISYKLIFSILKKYFDEVPEERIKETINDISRFKTSSLSLDEFNSNIDKNIFKECYDEYESYKKENKVFDFDDLEIKCEKILLENNNILNGYRKLFKNVLIDEFQDCDSIQVNILKLLNGENNSIFAVGDEDQCIYGFRGARPDYMVNFSQNFLDGRKIYLSMNYRCPINIVDLSFNLIENNKMRNRKEIHGYREEEKILEVINAKDENNQAFRIGNIIEKMTKSNSYKYEENAILYRTNVESRSFIDEFIRKKIPFKLLDKQYNFFNHFICRDIIAYLKLSLDNSDKESFLRIINKPFRYIGKINLNKINNNLNKENCFESLKSIKEVPVFQLKIIDELQRDVNYLNYTSLDSAVSSIMVSIGYNKYLKEYSDKFKTPLDELEQIVEEFREAIKGYNGILEFLCHVKEVQESIDSYKNQESKGVILSTIHGVKGMEFKNVFIINCDEGIIPHENSMDNKINLEEERRLFYVAITRAIDNLWISTTEIVKGKAKDISRFVKECNLVQVSRFNSIEKNKIVIHKVFGEGKVIDVKENYISILFKDGIKRKFDGLISMNNGLITLKSC
ncbi:ATP-dependent helicase [Haloimpatiens sp. FM7315]|uniref:ATP-dependent helicase n=1 Tax=Haloimpatiens sp. FM7315 TaxID=3298609 RepID=UPI003709FA39